MTVRKDRWHEFYLKVRTNHLNHALIEKESTLVPSIILGKLKTQAVREFLISVIVTTLMYLQ